MTDSVIVERQSEYQDVEFNAQQGKQTDDYQEIALNAGQTLSVRQDSQGTLLSVNASGGTMVSLRITAAGAEVLLGNGCAIRSSGDMTLEADALTLRAKEQLNIESGGDAELKVKGDFSSWARIQTLRSTLGNVNIKANDDVKVRAERICLNT